MNSESSTEADALPLFPAFAVPAFAEVPAGWREKAAAALATAHGCQDKLWALDRMAARLLAEAPQIPLRGRCVLELVRRAADAAGVPVRILNALAQIAQRRWKAAGLPVTFSRRSPLDLISDTEWRSLPLAPELAALAAQRCPSDARA